MAAAARPTRRRRVPCNAGAALRCPPPADMTSALGPDGLAVEAKRRNCLLLCAVQQQQQQQCCSPVPAAETVAVGKTRASGEKRQAAAAAHAALGSTRLAAPRVILGFALARVSGLNTHLLKLAVVPEARRRGIGRALLAALRNETVSRRGGRQVALMWPQVACLAAPAQPASSLAEPSATTLPPCPQPKPARGRGQRSSSVALPLGRL